MDILKDIEKSFLNINVFDKETDRKNAKDPFNNANSLKLNELKNKIREYFKKKDDENNIILQKKLKFEDNYKFARERNNYNYLIFLEKKRELYNTYIESKTHAALHDYLDYKIENYSHVPDIYTYEHINLDEKVPVAAAPIDKNAIVCPPGKVLNPKTNRCINDKTKKKDKKDDKKEKKEKKEKDDKKEKDCPPGKVLNPKTNRCIKDVNYKP
jgi:hypothetical protein